MAVAKGGRGDSPGLANLKELLLASLTAAGRAFPVPIGTEANFAGNAVNRALG